MSINWVVLRSVLPLQDSALSPWLALLHPPSTPLVYSATELEQLKGTTLHSATRCATRPTRPPSHSRACKCRASSEVSCNTRQKLGLLSV